jgi:hypothetical protein
MQRERMPVVGQDVIQVGSERALTDLSDHAEERQDGVDAPWKLGVLRCKSAGTGGRIRPLYTVVLPSSEQVAARIAELAEVVRSGGFDSRPCPPQYDRGMSECPTSCCGLTAA